MHKEAHPSQAEKNDIHMQQGCMRKLQKHGSRKIKYAVRMHEKLTRLSSCWVEEILGFATNFLL
jgi:hypothetical protein